MKPSGSIAGLFAVLALVPGLAGSAGANGYEFCTDPARVDEFACRELVVLHAPSFDAAAFARKYQLVLIGLIPELSQAWFEAPVGSPPMPELIQSMVDDPTSFDLGFRSAEVDGDFESPECRQLNADVIDLGPDASSLYTGQPALAVMGSRPDSSLGRGVIVAVLDTGVSREQPELRSSLLPGITFEGNSWDDSGNGLDDDADGTVDSGWGHGTAVAGVIHLVAPGAKILPVRVLDDECHGRAFSLAAGIVEAVKRGARVLNLSFGSDEGAGVITDAIEWARARGVMVVVPTGNEGESGLLYPAKKRETTSVAAVDNSLRATDFTNYKQDDVVLSAPGQDIVSTRRGSLWQASGTSFASAFVSGAAALVVQLAPGLDVDGLQGWLTRTAIPVAPHNPGMERDLGAGVPNLGLLGRLVHVQLRRHPAQGVPIGSGATPLGREGGGATLPAPSSGTPAP